VGITLKIQLRGTFFPDTLYRSSVHTKRIKTLYTFFVKYIQVGSQKLPWISKESIVSSSIFMDHPVYVLSWKIISQNCLTLSFHLKNTHIFYYIV